jgi:ribose transport system ATP-binding protein
MNIISLSARNIVKRYGGVIALSDGSLDVQSGEVVALVGANGSGKSTLTKVITGVVAPNSGDLLIDGERVSFTSPQAAKKLGISAVYQELSLIPDMTVAENIWLTQEPLRLGVRVNRREMNDRTHLLLDRFGGAVRPSLAPETIVDQLPPDEKQVVEILKALSLSPRLMILDEATASLDSNQVNRLFELIREWKAQGMAIVFVSHRMDEIFRVADRATVLRNGKSVGHLSIAETSVQQVVELMIGAQSARRAAANGRDLAHAPVRLEVTDLRSGRLAGVTFTLREGELLGLGGLQGQGQTDLLMAMFGAVPFSGQVMLEGQPVRFTHPRQAMRAGVALVPGERAAEGLLLIRSIIENLQLPSWVTYGTPLDMKRARRDASDIARDLRLVMESLDAPVSSLSGGNAQKVVIGKWLLRQPRLLLLNDPTKGVDVGAKAEFYTMLTDLRNRGTSILFYSTDDDELVDLCDRVLVLHDGQVAAELSGDSLNHENLVSASMGTFSAHSESAP